MNDSHWVNYRPLEALIVPKDQWVNGRVVLIGDAAHATTPHLASGAGLAVEDALVLGEELTRSGRSVDDSLAAFVERRFDRCKDAVDTGIEVGKQQLAHAGPDVLGPMIGGALHRLAKHF
jgi:2-polyprenyl-6-methoxyphenol hydroxylase-like FAD-dependent oxidoreductase